jgi:hypothetical protein
MIRVDDTSGTRRVGTEREGGCDARDVEQLGPVATDDEERAFVHVVTGIPLGGLGRVLWTIVPVFRTSRPGRLGLAADLREEWAQATMSQEGEMS